jgi:hypothetical protein
MMNTKPTVSPKRTTKTPTKAKPAEAVEAEWLSSPAGREKTHQQFLDAAKNGTLRRGTPPVVLKALAAAGRTVSINIRVAAADVQKAHELANEKGVGYQTVIKMLLHEALKDKKTHKAG